MSYVEGSAVRSVFSKRSRILAVALVVTAMIGTGLTLNFTSSGVDAAPVAEVVDQTVCYGLDEGTGDETVDVQHLHEITLTAGNPPTAAKTPNPPLSEDAGNIESIALRNDASELYAYEPVQNNEMYLLNADTGAQSTPTDFNLSGLGDIDAMFFQYDNDGDPTNDRLWTVLDIDDGNAGNVDQDELRAYNAAGTLVAGPIALNLPADATVEGATWVPDHNGGTGEFFITYTETAAGADSTLASLGTAATPSATPAVIGTTQIDVEGMGTDGANQMFITTGEDGADADNFYHVDATNATTTFLFDMSTLAPAGADADFESIDCAYASLDVTKEVTDGPTRLVNGNTEITYTFTLTNDGELQLAGVGVNDPMTAFVNAGSIESGPTPDDNAGTCSSDALNDTAVLNIGESCTAVWTYEVDVPPGDYENTATASGTPPNGIASQVSNTGAVTAAVPAAGAIDLQIIKSVRSDAADCPATYADAVAAGDEGLGNRLNAAAGTDVVYCINVINNGPGIAENVAVSDTYDPVDPHAIGTLDAGAEDAYSYVRTIATNPETNTATVTGDDQDGNAGTADTDQAGTADPPPDPGSISDRVWEDADGNGIQDAGEGGISNVTVNLYAEDPMNAGQVGSLVTTTTTDANGNYSFENLAPGNYFVEFVTPTGRTITPQNEGGDDTVDSDAGADGFTGMITVDPGEDDSSVDAGMSAPPGTGTISDFVWQDDNGNGVQDGGEPGIGGVTVRLLEEDPNNPGQPGNVVTTTTTDGNGNYSFDNLVAGNYFVEFVTPTGRTIVDADQGADDATDSDPDPATGISPIINLGAGATNDSIDAGMTPLGNPGSISNFVWEDTDDDGVQDVGEPGIGGVTVRLLEEDPNNAGQPGSVIGTTTTDAGGNYSFDNLAAGNYFVEFVTPTGRTISDADQGGDDAADSDPDPTTGRTGIINLGAGVDDESIDAGMSPLANPGSISNFVWEDTDDDGIQDAGEPGIAGVTVRLLQEDPNNAGQPGAVIATDTTDGNGLYSFDNLAAGNYFVEFVTPTGRTLSDADQGGDDATDSDADPTTGRTGIIALGAGEDDDTIDAGMSPLGVLGSISNFVWEDTNDDGIQDAGEPGIGGVTVNLRAEDPNNAGQPGAVIATDTTDGNGLYSFDNLAAGNYFVEFVTPTGRTLSDADQGGDDATDSDANVNTGMTGLIALGAGVDNDTVDAGMSPLGNPGSISNFVWEDTNDDGIQDAGEPGIAGVTVNLRAEDPNSAGQPGAVIATDTTDTDGLYSFDNLAAGNYFVEFVTPTGRTLSDADQGGDDATDSDANVNTGMTALIDLTQGEDDDTVDAGMSPIVGPGSISNFVWEDTNDDGIQDAGEPGIDGVTVNLFAEDPNNAGQPGATPIATDVTQNGGEYLFDNLAAGNYFVEFVTPTGRTLSDADQGGDDAADSDADPTSGMTAIINLDQGEDDDSIDAGMSPVDPGRARIGNFVWNDENRNGIQDTGEPGIAGATVNVWATDAAGEFLPGATPTEIMTDANGMWTLDVDPGNYRVNVVIPAGAEGFTMPNAGDDTVDSDVSVGISDLGYTGVYTVAGGDENLTIDAGVLFPEQPAELGDRVWRDENSNGIQDAGEPGVSGIVVQAIESGGGIAGSATTDADGNYLITDLDPGVYTVNFVNTTSGSFTAQNAGGDDSVDSDANATGSTAQITLAAGDSNLTVDAGLIFADPVSAISDLVFEDTDGDGIQDAGEPGIPGVTVTLYAEDPNNPGQPGTEVATTVTDANGMYTFDDVAGGNYIIEFTPPTGRTISPADQGGDDALDSDPDPTTGQTGVITVVAGVDDDSVDAGMSPLAAPGSISDRVWEDTDGDGVQDADEPGIGQITVNLLGEDPNNPGQPGSVIGSAVTDANGLYNFGNLSAGNYFVQFVAPTGRTFSPADQGGDDATDSDADPTTGRTGVIALGAGDNNTTVDAGLLPIPDPGTISDFIWEDTDGDGIQDAGEPGIDGVTVNLRAEDPNNPGQPGAIVATTTTSNGGMYSFDNVAPGNYFLEVTAPNGREFGPANQGGDDNLDSDVDENGLSGIIAVDAGEDNSSVDAAMLPIVNPVIGLAKRVTAGPTIVQPVTNPLQHHIEYTFVIENLGNQQLTGIVLDDNFAEAFDGLTIEDGPNVVGGTCGTEVVEAPGHTLAPGESCTAVWDITIAGMVPGQTYTNSATVTANPPQGDPVTDTSDNGIDPDPNGNGDPGDPGEDDPTPAVYTIDGGGDPQEPGCFDNDGNPLPDNGGCPDVLDYPGPFKAVPAPDPVPTAPPLAHTGSNSSLLATLAIALMGAGGALMIGARRRHGRD